MPFMPANTIAQPKPAPAAPAPAAPPPQPASPPPLSNRPSANEEIEAAFSGTDPVDKPVAVIAKEKGKPPVKTEPAPPQDQAPKTEAPQPNADDEYLVDQAKPAPQPQPTPPADPVPVKAPELRAAYAKSKAKVAELEKQLADLKAKPIEDEERKTFTDKILDLNKKLEEAHGRLKFAAWEQSDEYKKKYEEPFVETWQEGVQQAQSLTVTTPGGETRKGTADDFQLIMSEPDNERAAQMASDLFGANAFYLLAQRRELQKLNYSRSKALQEYRSTLSERVKQEKEQAEKSAKELEERRVQAVVQFKKLNEAAAKKYPEWFAPIDGDDEGNKLLEKGYKDADLAFEGGDGLTSDQIVKLHSAIRNRSAAFGRLVHQLKQKDSKIAELQKQLDEINQSAPGAGEVRGEEPGKPKMLTFEEELEAVARRA